MQLTAHSSQLTAHSSQLTAHSSQLTAHSSQLTSLSASAKSASSFPHSSIAPTNEQPRFDVDRYIQCDGRSSSRLEKLIELTTDIPSQRAWLLTPYQAQNKAYPHICTAGSGNAVMMAELKKNAAVHAPIQKHLTIEKTQHLYSLYLPLTTTDVLG